MAVSRLSWTHYSRCRSPLSLAMGLSSAGDSDTRSWLSRGCLLLLPWSIGTGACLVSVFKAGECFMSEAGLTLPEVCWSLRWGCGLATRVILETWK